MNKENIELVKNKENLNLQNKESKKRSSLDKELERSDTKDFAKRLSILLDKLNKKPHAFALEADIPVQTFYKYVGGISEPSRPIINAIIKASGVNPEWLLSGNGPMMKSEALSPVPSQETSLINKPYTITNLEGNEITFTPSPNLINIPVLTMEAACGTGTFSDDSHITAMFSATREWLVRHLNRNPDHLCLIQAKGDSMTDTIKPNDMVFVDPEDAKSPTDGIWVFSIENQIFLKRLQFLPKQKLKVISDNPAYETYFLDLDETFRLLARYIATLSVKI